ncbi:hypothetical protein CLV25_105190 [Acetobacteroides hydrogenigenes]|uniref:Uncharacterized protein n=1 Tax=Acetobacteroides hydrogenigenes TaxID=979970 RepID=A0A4R2EJ02_9BACT|nr:hypothetical protein CLV25_105190 [Acetobacteroides hydrogenigenes]
MCFWLYGLHLAGAVLFPENNMVGLAPRILLFYDSLISFEARKWGFDSSLRSFYGALHPFEIGLRCF